APAAQAAAAKMGYEGRRTAAGVTRAIVEKRRRWPSRRLLWDAVGVAHHARRGVRHLPRAVRERPRGTVRRARGHVAITGCHDMALVAVHRVEVLRIGDGHPALREDGGERVRPGVARAGGLRRGAVPAGTDQVGSRFMART